MKISGNGNPIKHITTITHDGKVLVFGVGVDYKIYYSVKRSGFEDSALQEGADPFGFEDWKLLRLGESVADASVIAADKANYGLDDGTILLRSVYGDGDEVTKTVDAPVQVVSALSHVCVFRQSPSPNNKILVSRFVLDGMTNELVPKFEVRFRRSRQKLTPQESATSKNGSNFDNLDYRDIAGNYFYEPSLELGFVGTVQNGWLAPLFVVTAESDRFRWHIFTVDTTSNKVVLYSVGSEEGAFFDIKDYLYGKQDPNDPENTIYRSISGIIRREFALKKTDGTALTVRNGPGATTFDLQHEQITDSGPQLLRDAMKLMLVVPVSEANSTVINAAALTFAMAKDGTLSQVDLIPDSQIKKSSPRDVITSLTLLDDIKEISGPTPPGGTIIATDRDDQDRLLVQTGAPLHTSIQPGTKVKIRGTTSYDGFYSVIAVPDPTSFQVNATFEDNQAGSFEVVPTKAPTGLVFENMVVGSERTHEGKLLIRTPGHDLAVGDDVQILGTQDYNGVFTVAEIDALRTSFVLDVPYFAGEAANLKRTRRRGLRMNSGDRAETPDLELLPTNGMRDFGRTISAWIRVDALGNAEQNIVSDGGGLMRFSVGADNKVKLSARMSDGSRHVVVDPSSLVAGAQWTYFSGSVNYVAASGNTTISLYRSPQKGNALAPAEIVVSESFPEFNGTSQMLTTSATNLDLANKSFSIEIWVKRSRLNEQEIYLSQGMNSALDKCLHMGFRADNGIFFGLYGDDLNTSVKCEDLLWHHYACTYDSATRTQMLYRDGVLIGQRNGTGDYVGTGAMVLGRYAPEGNNCFKGGVFNVRVWDRMRTPSEIASAAWEMNGLLLGTEPNLMAYWPLSSGNLSDLSVGHRHFSSSSNNPSWTQRPTPWFPSASPVGPGTHLAKAMRFDGIDDYVQVPGFDMPSDTITVSVWARSSTPVWSGSECLVCKRDVFIVAPSVGTRNINVYLVVGDNVPLVYTMPEVQNWHFYTFTYNGQQVCLYVDGVLRASANKTGGLWRMSGPLRIGHDDLPEKDMANRRFAGDIANVQIWNRARNIAEITQDMSRKLVGSEQGLVGCWPLDNGPKDISPNGRHGVLMGNPIQVSLANDTFTIGGTFTGDISDVQIWERARTVDELNATRHLQLTGKEPGLVAYYRMGAVVYETLPPTIPDFSAYNSDAIVYGTPYAGARMLNRAISLDPNSVAQKAIEFSSSELVVVSQRGTYEEMFEFRVNYPANATPLNPNNVNNTGKPLFTFEYWGKSSRGSKETIDVKEGGLTRSSFVDVGNGWYKATCRVVVPNGMNLMRAFGLRNLQGRWGNETTAPTDEWTSIEVRRHRIQLISDAITQDSYLDTVSLASLTYQNQKVQDQLTSLVQGERLVAVDEKLLVGLRDRLAVAQFADVYRAEKIALDGEIAYYNSEKDKRLAEKNDIINHRYANYKFITNSVAPDLTLLTGDDSGYIALRRANAWLTERQYWRLVDTSDGVQIINGKTKNAMQTVTYGNYHILALTEAKDDSNFRFSIIDRSSGKTFVSKAHSWVMDCHSTNDGQPIEMAEVDDPNRKSMQWVLTDTGERTTETKDALRPKDLEIEAFNAEIDRRTKRSDELAKMLDLNDTVDGLDAQIRTAIATITIHRRSLAMANQDVLDNLSAPAETAAMALLATDERALSTNGAILDFVKPRGRIGVVESAEGNVLLSYFDTDGRMRVTPYDAVADSRNIAFERWVPDAVRSCLDFRDRDDKATMAQAVTLPVTGWTFEAWVRYPLATQQSDGLPYRTSALASVSSAKTSPFMVRNDKRIGVMVDDWFFDMGVDLSQVLTEGWHHLTAVTNPANMTVYADGVKIGSRDTLVQPAMRFNGSTDYVGIPAFVPAGNQLTVSIWLRSSSPTWTGLHAIISQRGTVVLHTLADTTTVRFCIAKSAALDDYAIVDFTMPEIQGWHLITGVYDGAYIRLYVDGEHKAYASHVGDLQPADANKMLHIAYDTQWGTKLPCDIAEVSVWNVARSPAELRADVYRSFKGDEAGLVGYWRMNATEKDGQRTVIDLTSKTGNAKTGNGTIVGAPQNITSSVQQDMAVKYLGNIEAGGCPAGRLSELRMWNLCLTEAEVAAHARVALSGYEPGLLAYFPMTEAGGTTANDRSANGLAHATVGSADWFGCSAPIGDPGNNNVLVLGTPAAHVKARDVDLAGKSFTIECWVKRSSNSAANHPMILSLGGAAAANKQIFLAFRPSNKLVVGIYGINDCESPGTFDDLDWHHYCATYDNNGGQLVLYRDGVVVNARQVQANFSGGGQFCIGAGIADANGFSGAIAEVRVWNKARTQDEIGANMCRCLSGTEPGLLACYALNDARSDGKTLDKKTGLLADLRNGATSTSLPIGAPEGLGTVEYSTVEIGPDGKKQALLRRMLAYAANGEACLYPEQRVEELTLQWVGNSQINPTLLGYIEGAPPVPSENLTQEWDYNGATSVTLTQSDEVGYSWQRSESSSAGYSQQTFVGTAWSESVGLGYYTKIAEGKLGATGTYEHSEEKSNASTITTTSTLTTSDRIALTGVMEQSPTFPQLGNRWVPKNTGYALVISGMADVFVTKLRRSGRMVGYEIRPVEGVPLDVNTITFMMNPAYVLNGSLDGMVGSSPAHETFYPQVPDMRAQYGTLYPASYFRVKDAYAMKDAIERDDKRHESFFYNSNSKKALQSSTIEVNTDASSSSYGGSGGSDSQASAEETEQQKKDAQAEAAKTEADMAAKHQSINGKTRAGAAFDDWQRRMENIQRKAGKRNIVNTYVWDGDGGLRTEEQSFASTIEHSMSTETTDSGGAGVAFEGLVAKIKWDVSVMGTGAKISAHSKTLSTSKSLQLTVDLSGVERKGITDLDDAPRVPGEKVDRYRFMTFYLEGSTDYFNDFFTYVVDPEWLQSNDEEAMSLRQARGARPSKPWRVLHRVTYVERPALMKSIGRDTRALMSSAEVSRNPTVLQEELMVRVEQMEAKLDAILAALAKPAV